MSGRDLPVLTREGFVKELDSLKNRTGDGAEFWYGRSLMERLGYARWENFVEVIGKAEKACESAGVDPSNHFLSVTKEVSVGSGAMAPREDYILSRYACYLTAMNGDVRKPEIALAQSYFAIQARRQELADQNEALEKRLELRDRVKSAVKGLNSAAKQAGVQNYGVFHDAGYRGLYGIGLRDIKKRKNIPDKDELFDRAGRAELAANEFRITQAEEKLRKENIKGERSATDAHHRVGQEVRAAIQRIGGTMPEKLPAEESIKQIERKQKKADKGKALPPPSDPNET